MTLFHLNERTGELVISSPLDRESSHLLVDGGGGGVGGDEIMTLYVSASYRDTPTRTDHAIIHIRLLDCNDNAPTFTRPLYTTQLHSNTALPDTPLLRVEAIDSDAGLNGQVVYSIDSSEYANWFDVGARTGVVSLRIRIDFEDTRTPDQIELTIRARDSASNSIPLTSTTRVVIRLVAAPKLPPRCHPSSARLDALVGRSRIGIIRAHDPDLGVLAHVSFKLLKRFDLFELRPSGRFNSVVLASRPGVYLKKSHVYDLVVRAYSNHLHTDCLVQVHVTPNETEHYYLNVPARFKLVFNNYKNYFLTERMARVPLWSTDDEESNIISNKYTLVDAIGRQLVGLNERTGELTLKPLLNSNNQINASFEIEIERDLGFERHRVRTTCELVVAMVTDEMIAQSVTLTLLNVDIDLFLTAISYDVFVDAIWRVLPQLKKVIYQIFKL